MSYILSYFSQNGYMTHTHAELSGKSAGGFFFILSFSILSI